MKNIFLIAMIAIFVSACGYKSPYNYNPKESVTQYGGIGDVKTVLSGDSIMHYQVEEESDALNVLQNLSSSGYMIPKGIYRMTGEDSTKIYFSDRSIKGAAPQVGLSGPATGIVFFKDTRKVTLMLAGDYLLTSWDSGFKLETYRLKKTGEDFSMRSIGYASSRGQLVSFFFKEGINEHRVTHNMENGNIFRYSGAEIEIIKYDKESLTCKILRGLDVFK